MRRARLLALVTAVLAPASVFALTACGSTAPTPATPSPSTTSSAVSAGTTISATASATARTAPASTTAHAAPPGSHAHWSYEGAQGPAHWADLDAAYRTCATGRHQSPIDLTGAQGVDLPALQVDYRRVPLTVTNPGHTQQVVVPAGSSLRRGGDTYALLQAHLHVPSEHTVDGRRAVGELHLVHRAHDGRFAVIGVLIGEGAANAALAPLVDHLEPTPGRTTTVPGATIDLEAVLPTSRTYTTYPGSLTTPPCTEGVTWLVLDDHITMSRAQLDLLGAALGDSARPVQPRHDRPVEHDAA